MIIAGKKDKQQVVHILAGSFIHNKSVQYIIKGGDNTAAQVKALMEYSFEICRKFGAVFLNEDKTACALILYPDKKRTSLQTMLLDITLIWRCVGLKNVKKVMEREKKMKQLYPAKNIFYLWYIAVEKQEQGKGTGTGLLQEICVYAAALGKDIYLETSAEKNIQWYEKMGFELYSKLNFTYTLSCFRKKYAAH